MTDVKKKWTATEDVVRAWQTSASIREAAEKIGMREDALRQRAYLLRKRGVNLKPMGNPTRKLDIAALNELANSLAVPARRSSREGGTP